MRLELHNNGPEKWILEIPDTEMYDPKGMELIARFWELVEIQAKGMTCWAYSRAEELKQEPK
jgi:hypothetical protein